MSADELDSNVLPDNAVDPLMDADRVVGKPLSRLDGRDKVAGEARFTADVPADGLAYATLVCSTIARGRIAHIDRDEAARVPGVVLIVTHQNAPRMAQAPALLDLSGAAQTLQPIMQDALIRWNGEPVALVAAETQEQADYAASLLRVTYEEESARLAFDRGKSEARQPASVLGEPAEVRVGDAEDALAAAATAVDQVYRTPRYNHCALELHATMAEWHDDERLTVHDASQAISLTRATFAEVFGLRPENVRVLSPFVGGGFGNKLVWSHQILCVAAARLLKRPVRLVLSREAVFRATGGRTLSEQRVALGAKADGTLAALIHTGTTTMGVDNNGWPEQFSFPARHLYAAEALHLEQKVLELNMVANTTMRAPGESIGTFALESAIDELAAALRVDPIDLRRRLEPTRDPVKGTPFSSRNLIEAYARGAERFGWDRRNPTPRSRREGEWWVGHGVATAFYPYNRFPGARASVRLTADGRAVVRTAAHEMGMGTATVQAQHAAERLGLPIERVAFEYGDSDYPTGVVAGSSAQTASIIAAVSAASRMLFEELLSLAGADSPLAGLSVGEVEARNGGLFWRAAPEVGESYASILKRGGRDHLEREATASMPFEMMAYSMHSYGAQFCEVRVNDVTGEVRIARWLGSFDTGRILNPKTAASQLRGGIVMGIGMALAEETLFDERTGRLMNPSLAEYHVPVHADVPVIDVTWTGIPDPRSPMGGKGIGEIGITGVAAAIVNAVFNATGKRVRELPITPEKLL